MEDDSPAPQSVAQINVALTAALGIPDPQFLRRVELVIAAGVRPTITATYLLPSADGLREVMQRMTISAAPMTASPDTNQQGVRDGA
jgi:hypothetical protein